MKIIRLIILVFALNITCTAYAIDATENITEIKKSGHWQVVEFAAANQLLYRLVTTSINDENITIVFDFVPSNNCFPSPATMIINFGSYTDTFNGGVSIMEYKFPGGKKFTEVIKTAMNEGDVFAFFPFQKLTTEKFYRASGKGKLAIWLPMPGGQGKSGNMYFSLDGFMLAHNEAKKLCSQASS